MIDPLGDLRSSIKQLMYIGGIAQMLAFKAAAGKAFTIFLAGFAFTMTTLPKTSRLPALVAGLVRIFSLHKPGIANTPAFFTLVVATSARVSKTFAHTDFFSSQLVANASAIAPLVMAFAPAFMVFIGAMLLESKDAHARANVGDLALGNLSHDQGPGHGFRS